MNSEAENPVVWRRQNSYNLKQNKSDNNIPPQQLIPRANQQQQQQEQQSDLNLANILHYLQSEWRRYDRDRNEWEIERAEMRARLALLEGEKRASDNVKSDLLRRVRMLEYALRQERAKYIALSQPRSTSPKSANSGESINEKPGVSAIHPSKKASLKDNDGSDSQKSDDSQTLASSNTLLNNHNSNLPQWLRSTNPSKDTKTRAKSRQYLQQCLEEITYLTHPTTLNPLTARPHKDADGFQVEKLPQSVPMESSSPNNSNDNNNDNSNNQPMEKLDEQLSNSLSDSVSIKESPAGPIVSQPIIETQESVQATLAPPTGPSSPPAVTTNDLIRKDENVEEQTEQVDQNVEQQPEQTVQNAKNDRELEQRIPENENEQGPEDDQDDQTVIDDSDDHDPENESETTFTQTNEEKDTNQSIELKEQTDNLVPPENPLNAQLPEEQVKPEEDKPSQSAIHLTTTGESSCLNLCILMRFNIVDDDNDNESIRSATSSMSSSQGLWKSWKTLKSHIDPVRAVVFKDINPEQALMMTAGDDTVLKYWKIPKDTNSIEEIQPIVNLRGHTAPITSIAVSKTKNVVYTSSIDTTIREWEITDQDGDLLDLDKLIGKVYEGHTNAIWGLACTSTGKLISAASDSTIKIWNEKTGELERSINVERPCSSVDLYEENDEMKLVVGLTDKRAIMIDLNKSDENYTEFLVDDAQTDNDTSVQFNDLVIDGDRMYSAHEDGKIRLWLLPGGQRLETLIAHLDSCTAIAFQPNTRIMASASHDCSIRFWTTDKFSQIHSPGVAHAACVQECGGHKKVFSEGVNQIAFTLDGDLFASAGGDGNVKLYYK
ncbi:WD40 repeat-like protein [Wallemia mellicola]|uniref:WD40 repeat-like protein n=1 Tax=Wallemia mellicola TaxID=1708541 RepID=A0A4T0QUA6_9BASI|nr:WD40 repeat-like protein [Wallemia mellicola]